jgi:hypothetical protein
LLSKNRTEYKISYANDSVVPLDRVALSAPTVILRSGLPNSAAKFLREKTGRAAFLGGYGQRKSRPLDRQPPLAAGE